MLHTAFTEGILNKSLLILYDNEWYVFPKFQNENYLEIFETLKVCKELPFEEIMVGLMSKFEYLKPRVNYMIESTAIKGM